MQIESKIMEHVKCILNKFGNKYIENDKLKRNKVIEDLDAYDKKLMQTLLSDKLIHDTYTEKVLNTEIFKLNQFVEMFEYKEFWQNSYTKYLNKIGLTANGKFIDESADVVLDFPYKDTKLKAGMTKEDLKKNENADEPFLNEIIAKAEIDELLEPKILVNTKKYDQNGEHEIIEFNDDDNLILKGNNLIALYSIKKRYSDKVKLIYLDPPYNTGNDDFNYNDRFNHSSWLTFIKNRLEIAKELLTDDGIIVIQCDDNEQAYLKVLMDEVFGRKNFVNTIAVKMTPSSGQKRKFSNIKFIKNKEYLLFYKKNQINLKQLIDPTDKYDNHYNIYFDGKEYVSLGEKLFKISGKKVGSENYLKNKNIKKFIIDNSSNIYRTHQPSKWAKDNFERSKNTKDILCVKKVYNDEFTQFEYLRKNQNGKLERLEPLSWKLTDDKSNIGTLRGDFWDNGYEGDMGNINKEGTVHIKFGQGQKPERLLKDIILSSTKKDDIVLDFFMGSGTTQAVAMKMKRHFIGIEQMDYISTVSVPRLQKVIAGEQGGISKTVDWQGGGSFIYAELMEKNQGFIMDIKKANTLDELSTVYMRMKDGADLDFRVDLAKFDEIRSKLSLNEQKEMLFKMLDKNQLYFNINNIDDIKIKELISDTDYKFNKSFYKEID